MSTLTVRIPDPLASQLERNAERLGMSRSELVRRAVEAFLARELAETGDTFGDLAADLSGLVEGPEDLSTEPTHMEGYGR